MLGTCAKPYLIIYSGSKNKYYRGGSLFPPCKKCIY